MKDTLVVADPKNTKDIICAITDSIEHGELEVLSIEHKKDSISGKYSITIVYTEKYK